MASFGIKLAKNFRLINTASRINNTIKRTLFAPSALGIDNFKKQQEKFELATVNTLETFRKRVNDTLVEDKPIFTEDLKTLLYLTRNDADLELLVKLFKKYKTKTLGIGEFTFGAPFMRLLYSMNKLNEALKFFSDPELSHIFEDQTSLLLLLNKLNEEKRYEEAANLFINIINNEKKFKDPITKKSRLNFDTVNIGIESLYHLNTADAFEKCKLVLTQQDKVPRYALAKIVLFALNQKQTEYAYEILSRFSNENQLSRNLKAIVLAHLGRASDAVSEANNILNSSNGKGEPATVFPLTLKTLREKIEDSKLRESVEELSKKVVSSNRLSNKDLLDILFAVIQVRMGPAQKMNNDNLRQNRFGGFNNNNNNNNDNRQSGYRQRDDRQQGGFNRQRDDRLQGGFNRAQQRESNFGGRFDNNPNRPRSQPPRRQESSDD